MILYGALKNHLVVLTGGSSPFTLYGAVRHRATVAVISTETTFPLYGAVLINKLAPTKLKIYGAVRRRLTAPKHFLYYSSKISHTSLGANISGLSISQITKDLHFSTPAFIYDISPYYINDVYKVIGGIDYLIVGKQLIFNTLPTGPIRVIPFSRLQINADEIKLMTVENLIPTRAEFKDIVVSSNGFMFSLDQITWTTSLAVDSIFYVKAPSMVADGTDMTQEIFVSARVLPRG